jgi:phospho-N-acetylmuramoyl-pentapeptide-transferase
MLYYLFNYLHEAYNFPGAGVFQYISFRASMAVICSLLISLIFGKKIIDYLAKKQVGETIRDLGLEGQEGKAGTPTMGGLIIIASILIPTLLFAKLDNIYVILMMLTTVWMGFIGFLDDYIKVFRKYKDGLAGKFKILGQVSLGLVVGSVLYFHPDVVVRESISNSFKSTTIEYVEQDVKSTMTTVPFIKNNEFDYSLLLSWMGENAGDWVWVIFIPMVVFIVTAVSNGANLTDGIDGLATGTSAIIGLVMAIFAYVSGNIIFADYLNIMYIPNSGELVIFIGSFMGACVGFLWYNSYPAQVFMGDTGSLALGGIIAVFAIAIRKELLIPIVCGVFLVENLSVVLQVAYFKYTKRKYGAGKRIFLMSPIHHHYQKSGIHESKIVTRFWIVGIVLAILSFVTLKLR